MAAVTAEVPGLQPALAPTPGTAPGPARELHPVQAMPSARVQPEVADAGTQNRPLEPDVERDVGQVLGELRLEPLVQAEPLRRKPIWLPRWSRPSATGLR